MSQWIRGRLEGHYVGRPHSDAGLPGLPADAERFHLQLYRATLQDVELWEGPGEADAQHEPEGGRQFRQARLPDARLFARAALGRVFEGELRDVVIVVPRVSHPARHAGAIYGRMQGVATARVELPPEPEDGAIVPLREVSIPVAAVPTDEANGNDPTAASWDGSTDEGPLEALSEETRASEGGAPSSARTHALPLLGVSALVAIGLWVAAGGAAAGTWISVALPTLFFRRMLRGVVEDARAVRAFALLLVATQTCATLSVLSDLMREGCSHAHPLALVAGLSALFLSGLLPWSLPLVLNGVGFAVVLWALIAQGCEVPVQNTSQSGYSSSDTPRGG